MGKEYRKYVLVKSESRFGNTNSVLTVAFIPYSTNIPGQSAISANLGGAEFEQVLSRQYGAIYRPILPT